MSTNTTGFRIVAEPGGAAPGPQSFPQQIQFRFNGVDLGGPDATVVDFVGAFTVTRGSGPTADVITVALA